MAEEIRRAASVIAVREGASGPEVLVLERSRESRFLPGYVVFPGGAVDDEDEALAQRWFGDPGEQVRAGAVRELAEEVGLVLTAGGLVAAGASHLDAADADPPAVAQLPEVAHWVAPEDVPVRFDARYYAVVAPAGLEPTPDGTEAAHAWWAPIGELWEGWEAGERKLYWPTWLTVRELRGCGGAAEVLGARLRTREPTEDEVERLPRSVFWED
jgi:8-oxo-dGTP pyrophosphatase MutT (NUDIX family)